ncbi:MAG: hypothetical protein RR363_07270 [Rikenellaceae bacterium]
MERVQIIERVLRCLHEAGVTNVVDPILDYHIDTFLDQAGREILKVAPIYTFKGRYATYTQQNSGLIDNGDGTGSVSLPENFVRLVAFRMEGWQRDVTHLYTTDDPIYHKQTNKYLRGGVVNPIMVIEGDRIKYYSLPQGVIHTIQKAEFLVHIPIELFDDILIDTLTWLAASKILDVLNESEQAEMAHGQYLQCLNLLKIC